MYIIKFGFVFILCTCFFSFGYSQEHKPKDAYQLFKEDKLTKAKEVIDAIASNEKYVNDPSANFYRSKIYIALGMEAIQQKDIQQLIEIADTVVATYHKGTGLPANDYKKTLDEESKLFADLIFNEGSRAYQNTNYDMAKQLYEKSCKIYCPDERKLLKAAATEKAGQYEQAKTLYNDLIEHGIQDKRAYTNIIILSLEHGTSEETQEYLYAAQQAFPGDVTFLQEQARILSENGAKQEQLKQVYNKILSIDPDDLTALYNLGVFAYNSAANLDNEGRRKDAEEKYSKALSYLSAAQKAEPEDEDIAGLVTNIKKRLGK